MSQQPLDDRRPAWEGGTAFPAPRNGYQQGYPQASPQSFPQSFPQQAQQQLAPLPMSQPRQVTQELKFYKSGLFGFSSAPGRFQRDVPKMAQGNWRVGRITHLGRNLLGQQTICVIYEK